MIKEKRIFNHYEGKYGTRWVEDGSTSQMDKSKDFIYFIFSL